jgi:hypothetical protein
MEVAEESQIQGDRKWLELWHQLYAYVISCFGLTKRLSPYFVARSVAGVNEVRQSKMRTAEQLVPEPSYTDFGIGTERLERCKAQVLTKFLQNLSGEEVHSDVRPPPPKKNCNKK